MNTILVWVLITVGGRDLDQVVYSPPMPDLSTCEFLQKNATELVPKRFALRSKCVQIRMVVTK